MKDVISVVADNEAGGRELVTTVVKTGIKNIFCLAEGTPHLETMDLRIRGVDEALKAARKKFSDLTGEVKSNYRKEDDLERCIKTQCRQLLRQCLEATDNSTKRCGVIFLQDTLCIAFLDVLKEYSETTGNNLFTLLGCFALFSYDDTNPLIKYLGITSAQNPAKAMGKEATELVIKWIRNKRRPEPPGLQPIKIAIRASSNPVVNQISSSS